MSEHDAQSPTCMCPWCESERRTYCALTRDIDDHDDHALPGICPATPEGTTR